MKNRLLLLALAWVAYSCVNDPTEEALERQDGLLLKILWEGKTDQAFHYQHGKLAKEELFGPLCIEHPVDEHTYQYLENQLHTINSVFRSLYASTTAQCNPSAGYQAEKHIKYDGQGRISKVVQQETYTEFFYNGQSDLVHKQTLFLLDGTEKGWTTFQYDANGNLVEELHSDGRQSFYTYDERKNPFYLIGHRPDWISPFNKSPNNVVKGIGDSNFERSIAYYANGLPKKVIESNGGTYEYVYKE